MASSQAMFAGLVLFARTHQTHASLSVISGDTHACVDVLKAPCSQSSLRHYVRRKADMNHRLQTFTRSTGSSRSPVIPKTHLPNMLNKPGIERLLLHDQLNHLETSI